MRPIKALLVGFIISLSIVLTLLVNTSSAQSNSMFPKNIDFFDLDILGQLYFVKGSELKKYSPDGELLQNYSNLYLGDITLIDVSDPMNLLVYYQDINQIVMLDNQLSIKNSPIDLNDLGYGQANLTCLSYSNGFWVFDPISQSLIRFNNLLEESDNSGNLKNITGYQIHPLQLIERDNQLILKDKEFGIFVFDRFGNYIKRIPFNDIDDIYIRSGVWQMLKNDTSLFFNPSNLQIDTIPIKHKNINEFRLNTKSSYYRYNDNYFLKVDF